MKTKNALELFFLIVSLMSMQQVNAGQSARKECLNAECSQFELHIKITSDREVGLRGVYGVLAVIKEPASHDGQVAYWTEDNQWTPLGGGEIIKPSGDLMPLKKEHDLVVFTGSHEDLCQLTHGNDVNLFAWHVGLKQSQLNATNDFLHRFGIVGWQATNFRDSLYFYEANHHNGAGWVYSYTCRRS